MVHGYQIEIDPSERSWTGGIYEESLRGWLYPLDNNIEAQKAFKQQQWNRFRIEAIGDTIKTLVNDVPTAHFVDEMTREGFIALQVHGIGKNKEKQGQTVRWRNIRIITDNPVKYSRPTPLAPRDMFNKLTSNE